MRQSKDSHHITTQKHDTYTEPGRLTGLLPGLDPARYGPGSLRCIGVLDARSYTCRKDITYSARRYIDVNDPLTFCRKVHKRVRKRIRQEMCMGGNELKIGWLNLAPGPSYLRLFVGDMVWILKKLHLELSVENGKDGELLGILRQ